MSEEESLRYCAAVFRDDLAGQPLLSNISAWFNAAIIRNERWSHGNVVLLGDALRTVHFSIGSGTRTALEDAIALRDALVARGATRTAVPAALADFEAARRPGAERLLDVARESGRWYEGFRAAMRLDPLPFAYSYLTRGGRITPERLRARSPRFAAALAAHAAARGARG